VRSSSTAEAEAADGAVTSASAGDGAAVSILRFFTPLFLGTLLASSSALRFSFSVRQASELGLELLDVG